MTIEWFLLLLSIAVYFYSRASLFYAHLESECDKKFVEAVERCQSLSNNEKKFLNFLEERYESRVAGILLLLFLYLHYPKHIFNLLIQKEEKKVKNYNLAEASYFWAKSHFYRNTFLAIAADFMFGLYKVSIILDNRTNISSIKCSTRSEIYRATKAQAL